MNDQRFQLLASEAFSSLSARFGLTEVNLPPGAVAFVSRGYGILVADDVEAIGLEYIRYDARKNAVLSYPLRVRQIVLRFTDEDRTQALTSPEGLEETILSDLRVFASGLEHRCEDILTGDETWLRRFKDKEPREWQGSPLRPNEEAFLRRKMPDFMVDPEASR